MKSEGDPVLMKWIIPFYPKNGLDSALLGTSQTKNYKCIGSNIVNHAQDWSWVKIFFDLPNKHIPTTQCPRVPCSSPDMEAMFDNTVPVPEIVWLVDGCLKRFFMGSFKDHCHIHGPSVMTLQTCFPYVLMFIIVSKRFLNIKRRRLLEPFLSIVKHR